MPKRLVTRISRAHGKDSAGFALIATIWALGLMTLLGTAAIVGARYRMMDSSSASAAVRAALAAEGAVNLAAAVLLQQPENFQAVAARFPLRCTLPGGEDAFITIENEAGKIDLNVARPQLIALLFSRLGGNSADVARIADRIVQFRQARRPAQSPLPASPPLLQQSVAGGNFVSVLQLDQVAEIPGPLFRAALPFLTVRSGLADPSVNAASPQLRRLLTMPAAVQSFATPATPERLAFTIRADVATSDGARFVRETVVSFGGERPFEIHEWRRGDIDRTNQRPQRMTGRAPACMQV